jgi:hypothetical protein
MRKMIITTIFFNILSLFWPVRISESQGSRSWINNLRSLSMTFSSLPNLNAFVSTHFPDFLVQGSPADLKWLQLFLEKLIKFDKLLLN